MIPRSRLSRPGRLLVVLLLLGGALLQPSPAARASESCPFLTELPQQVTLLVEGDHTDFDVWGVCQAVIEVEKMIGEYGLVLPSTTVYLVDAAERAQRIMAANPGRRWGTNLAGMARGTRAVILNERRANWQVLRTLTIHELIHVVQNPITEAQWLAEGAAQYLQGWAGAVRDNRLHTFARDLTYAHAQTTEVHLPSLESLRQFDMGGSSSYTAGFVAFHLLMSETENSLDDYFSCFIPEKKRMNWRTAFSGCFGVNVEDFYNLFEEYRSSGFAELPSERRERERHEFERLLDACLVYAVHAGNGLVRATC